MREAETEREKGKGEKWQNMGWKLCGEMICCPNTKGDTVNNGQLKKCSRAQHKRVLCPPSRFVTQGDDIFSLNFDFDLDCNQK